ncbi:hypothetical protein ACLNGM_15030 [Aureimonas phyllosphaerae]|uniref:hypothetical protein n=1 Tax=Aureimonas phyllosphaerae TaxID=1166078 RepID=UPI003A5B9CD1
MTENTKRELPDDILEAEGIARADESKVEILRGMAGQNNAYQDDLDTAVANAKESNDHVDKLRGDLDDRPADLSGVTRLLSDSAGNFAPNIEVATAGGIGVEASNTNPATGKPAQTADEAGIVQIPDGWESSHWRTRVALAERISGRDDVKAEEANDIISAERSRRG